MTWAVLSDHLDGVGDRMAIVTPLLRPMARQDRACSYGDDGHGHKVIDAVVAVNGRIRFPVA